MQPSAIGNPILPQSIGPKSGIHCSDQSDAPSLLLARPQQRKTGATIPSDALVRMGEVS